jgi:hypothetical protein
MKKIAFELGWIEKQLLAGASNVVAIGTMVLMQVFSA